MELKEYLRVLRGRWVLVLACTAVVVAVAGLITWQSTPQYSSSSRVFISTVGSKDATAPDTAYQGGLAATQRVQSYAALVSDGTLVNRVIDAMNLDLTPAELSREIKAEVVPETVVLQVQVTDPSARRAQAICQEVIEQLSELIGEIETPPGQDTPLLKATVVSPASLPTSAVTPDPVRNLLLALAIGLVAGVGAAIARELLDSSVKTGRDIDETLNAPLLGGIAMDPQAVTNPLITSISSHAPRAEAFRVLRTNLQFVNVDAPNKVIVVTSSLPGEGKSSTAVNVAIAMAQAGQRVLLVDGDLRRPQVAAMLDLESAVGVTTVLLGRVELDDAIQEHEPSGLAVLTSGTVPPNPAELLQSFAMTELLERIRADYDIVIVDSPPLLPVTDAALIASQADGAVLVVRHGWTKREQLAGARERLVGVDARLLGAVFNRLKTVGSGGANGYGYGYGYGPDTPVEPNLPSTGPVSARAADPVEGRSGTTPNNPPGRGAVPPPEEARRYPPLPRVADPHSEPGLDSEETSDRKRASDGGGSGAAVLSITKALRGGSSAEPRSKPSMRGVRPRFVPPGGDGDREPTSAGLPDAGPTSDADPEAEPELDLLDDDEAYPDTGTFLFSGDDEADPDGRPQVVLDDAPGTDERPSAAPRDRPDRGGDGSRASGIAVTNDLDAADPPSGVEDTSGDASEDLGSDEDEEDGDIDADLSVPWSSGRRARGRHRG